MFLESNWSDWPRAPAKKKLILKVTNSYIAFKNFLKNRVPD
jgi:hypothetical protein